MKYTRMKLFRVLIVQISIYTSVVTLINGQNQFAIAIHGGAGAITKTNMTPELEKNILRH